MLLAGGAQVPFVGNFAPMLGAAPAAGAKAGASAGASAGRSFGSTLKKWAGPAVVAGVAVGLFKLGETFDKSFDRIRVGTGQTGTALKGLQSDFRAVASSTAADFGTSADAVTELYQRTGQTGEGLRSLALDEIRLARLTKTDLTGNIEVTTRVFGDWGIATDQQSKKLNVLFRASQATGAPVDRLAQLMVKFGSPLRQLGFDFDTTAALAGKFEKEGVNTELVLGSLRIALGKMARSGEPAQETLKRVTGEIKNAGSTSEANAKALELFGARAGPDMAAAIREGRFELGSLFDTVANGSETLEQAGKDTSSFGGKVAVLKNKVLVGLQPLATATFDAVGNGLGAIAPMLGEVAGGFSQLVMYLTAGNITEGPFHEDGPVFAGLFAIRGAVVSVVGVLRRRLGPVVSWIGDRFGTLLGYLKPLLVPALVVLGGVVAYLAGSSVFAGLSVVVGAVVTALGALAGFLVTPIGLFGLLVAGVVLAYRELEPFRDLINGVARAIRRGLGSALSWMTDTAIPAVTEAWGILVKGDFTGAGPWAEDAPIVGALFRFREKVVGAVDAVKGAWDDLTSSFRTGDNAGGIFGPIGEKAEAFVTWITVDAIPAIKGAWDDLTSSFSAGESQGGIFGTVGATAAGVIDSIAGAWDDLVSGFGGEGTGGVFGTAGDRIRGVVDTVTGLYDTVTSIDWGETWGSVTSGASDLWSKVGSVDGLTHTLTNIDWGEIGGAVGEGLSAVGDTALSDWAEGMWNSLWDKVAGFAIGDGVWASIVEKAEPIIEAFRGMALPMIENVRKVFTSMREAVGPLIRLWTTLAKALAPVLKIAKVVAIAWVGLQFVLFKVATFLMGVLAKAITFVAEVTLPALTWVIEHVVAPAFSFIVEHILNVWDLIATGAVWLWSSVLQPTFSALADYFTTVVVPVWTTVARVATDAFGWIADKVSWAWDHVIKPVWNLLSAYITEVLIPGWGRVWDVVSTVWDGISAAISWAWGLIKPILAAVVAFIRDEVMVRFELFKTAAGIVWEAVSGAISTAWGVMSWIFEAIKGGITSVKNWISDRIDDIVGFFDGIGDRISGLAEVLSTPFRTAFGLIRSLWNNTIGKLSLSFDIPDVPGVPGRGQTVGFDGSDYLIPPLPEFHRGGIVPGRRGQEVPILAMAGEMVSWPTRKDMTAKAGGIDMAGTMRSAVAVGQDSTPDGMASLPPGSVIEVVNVIDENGLQVIGRSQTVFKGIDQQGRVEMSRVRR